LAYLTRFAASAYILGALLGVWFLREQLKDKLRITALLAAGAATPAICWVIFLHAVQGYVPDNYNFIHLTRALGQFQTFFEMDDLVREYGSFWGVLQSDPTVPLKLFAFGVKELIKYPFTVAFQIHFVLAGFLVPGLLCLIARRDAHAPWLLSFLAGLFLTGVSGLGWPHYYLPIIPFAVVLMVVAIELLSQPWGVLTRRLIALSIAAVVAVWSVADINASFLSTNTPEFGVARRYIERNSDPEADVVSCTAASLIYGSTLRFIDHSKIVSPDDSVGHVDRLRQHGVTYLVISERHTPNEFPELRSLLADVPQGVPDGLQRDTLITDPRRIAVYRVLPDSGQSGPSGRP
jgi:hypothetical protein